MAKPQPCCPAGHAEMRRMLDLIQAGVPLRWSRNNHKHYACRECQVFHNMVGRLHCLAAALPARRMLWNQTCAL